VVFWGDNGFLGGLWNGGEKGDKNRTRVHQNNHLTSELGWGTGYGGDGEKGNLRSRESRRCGNKTETTKFPMYTKTERKKRIWQIRRERQRLKVGGGGKIERHGISGSQGGNQWRLGGVPSKGSKGKKKKKWSRDGTFQKTLVGGEPAVKGGGCGKRGRVGGRGNTRKKIVKIHT